MTAQGNSAPYVLSLQDEEILLRSISSIRDRNRIVSNGKVPINVFSTKPEESVDLFTAHNRRRGYAVRVGQGFGPGQRNRPEPLPTRMGCTQGRRWEVGWRQCQAFSSKWESAPREH